MSYYKNYPHIFKPGKIGNLVVPNRIVMAPMGTGHTGPDLRFSEELIKFYVERAKGKTGMIISECCSVAPQIDPFPLVTGTPRLDGPDKIARLAQYVERVESYGTVAALQMTLGMGRQADAPTLKTPVSASECPAQYDPSVTCRALTKEEIHTMIECAGRAAGYALTAGIKLIEVHGHAGYLIDQFLNPEINKRTDEYGGNPENRFRIVKEMREAIRSVIGDVIPVTLRISVDHKFPGGRSLEEGLEYCRLAEEAGYDALHIDAGRYEVMPWIFPPSYLGPMCMLDLAAEVKKVVTIPVIAVGNFGTPEEAEEALASGKCDFVAMARALLADPEWVAKARVGHAEEIRPCIRCNEECVGRAILGKELACAVNPECGRETYNKTTMADERKKVAVIGGGPGGMLAAVIASNRGHDVTLMEKSSELGGLVNLAETEDFKYPIKQYNEYLKNQLAKSEAKVLLNTEATVDKIKENTPDAVIVATGSDVFMPGLPGFEFKENIGTIREFEQKELKREDRIVIAGGGMIASEAALGLKRKGFKHVTIVEMLPAIASELQFINMMSLVGELTGCGTNILTSTTCKAVVGDELICADTEGKEIRLPFDYLLVAMGTKSVNGLNEAVSEAFSEVYLVGDCLKPGKLARVIEQAYYAGTRV
ncbi:MAG: NAD(P)/FAD-dependent oxidoreductase [Anaerovoracaceae bacterium]